MQYYIMEIDRIKLQHMLMKGQVQFVSLMNARNRLISFVVTVFIIFYSIKEYRDVDEFFSRRIGLEEHFHLQNQDHMQKPDIPVIDIISVGSVLKVPYQDAQERTFGSHSYVRNYFRINENNDTDRECATELTNDHLHNITSFCKNTKGVSSISSLFRRWLFNPKMNAGWMCAQKRPIDGLHIVLQKYKMGEMDIPSYLFIIDDDTYINMNSLLYILSNKFPSNIPHLVAGCNFEFLHRDAMFFPYGGFGSFISKGSIQRLLQPINCTSFKVKGAILDPFTQLSCWRIHENLMGEQRYFTNGMSVADLMYKFSADQSFLDVTNWKEGYCFHSDHVLGYFFNMYHIAVPDSEFDDNFRISDKIRKKYKYTSLHDFYTPGRSGECFNEKEQCNVNNTVCHYIVPNQMDDLFRTTIA